MCVLSYGEFGDAECGATERYKLDVNPLGNLGLGVQLLAHIVEWANDIAGNTPMGKDASLAFDLYRGIGNTPRGVATLVHRDDKVFC